MSPRVPDGDRLACYGVSFGAAQRGTAAQAMGGRSCRFERGGERRLWPTLRSAQRAIPGGPDKVDLVPRESLLITHAATMG